MRPEQVGFDKFRARQQERAGAPADLSDLDMKGPGKTPLGLDPVEGDPVDLTQYASEDGTIDPTAAQVREANAAFDAMVPGELPEDFGELPEGFGLD
jgi:hypothetical protein